MAAHEDNHRRACDGPASRKTSPVRTWRVDIAAIHVRRPKCDCECSKSRAFLCSSTLFHPSSDGGHRPVSRICFSLGVGAQLRPAAQLRWPLQTRRHGLPHAFEHAEFGSRARESIVDGRKLREQSQGYIRIADHHPISSSNETFFAPASATRDAGVSRQ